MKPKFEPGLIKQFILRHQLPTAVGMVVLITFVLTGISLTLYVQSGASGLDLSRPGFVNTRKDLQQDASVNFSSTGELKTTDVEAFQRLYAKQRTILNSLSDFDDDSFSDVSLGLEPAPEP